MTKSKHNGIVGLWKFIFVLVIVVFHVHQFGEKGVNPFFSAGYIAVEFFFVVSGFYFAKSLLTKKEENVSSIGKQDAKMILEKIKKLAPYIIVAFIINIIIKIFSVHWTTDKWLNSIWNLFLLQNFGFGNVRIMGELWYLSVMLLVMYIMYPFLKKYKDNFLLIVSPVISILTLGYIGHFIGNLDVSFRPWGNYISLGFIRGLGEMCLGFTIYGIHESLKNTNYTVLGKKLLTFIQHFLLIMVLLVITFIKDASRYDFIMLLMIAIAVLIMTSQKTYDYNVLTNRFTNYLEQLSMPIFINHTACICLLNLLGWVGELHMKSCVTIVITIVFSIVEVEIFRFFKKKKLVNKIKGLLIK